ncbi:MAG: hypothetical protein HKN16_06590 [Saprospiraceae bacterium]|nr:hypothetical protein [Saprospiraceae bacterium]
MSIPKEPRQLMINLMYLVLTAMLALNVSAEIFNAFKIVDKGLKESNKSLDAANAPLAVQIQTLAKKKEVLQTYADRATPVTQLSKEFVDYIDGIWQQLEAGSVSEGKAPRYPLDHEKYPGDLVSKKNKDVTTRLLVDDGVGEELKAKIMDTREQFLAFFDSTDVANEAGNISMEVDDKSWRAKKDKPSWSAFNFKQMPLGALEPMFTKYKNDAKASESAVLNYLLGKVGGEDIVLDKFQVVSSPKKSYIIEGEPFETEIFLSASAGSSNTGVSISVNGRGVAARDGVAKYTTTASGTGVKNYSAAITVTNPVTNEVNTYKGTFEYEVGRRSVAVSADKMNVFYIGVDNPVSVSAAGISSNELKVTGKNVTLKQAGKGKWIATGSRPSNDAGITVSGGGLKSTTFPFRVKRIPDPVARLSKSSGGTMGNGEFKAQGGVGAFLDNFDFDAKCRIMGYSLVRVPKRQDAVESVNPGAKYNDKSRRLVNAASPGDVYFFQNVKSKCPGDSAGRKINDMVFKIK